MLHSAEDVAQLFERDDSALDNICMEGSDDELGMEEVEVVENPYYYHASEFDDFEELQGSIIYSQGIVNIVTKIKSKVAIQRCLINLEVAGLPQIWRLSTLLVVQTLLLTWSQIHCPL